MSNNQNIFIDGRLSIEAKKELLSDISIMNHDHAQAKLAIDLRSF